MRRFKIKNLVLSAIVLIPLFFSTAGAQELTLLNEKGEVLSVAKLDGRSKLQLSVNSQDGQPSSSSQITLTDTTTGEKIVASSVDGSVTFPDVSSGTYVITSSEPGVQFLNFEILAAASSVGVIAPVVGGVLAIGGATTAIVVANNDDNKPEPLSPSN